MSDTNCEGCRQRSENTTEDDLCLRYNAPDSLAARCSGDWANDKYWYLRRYCDIFTKGMKKQWRNLVFIDMFAGPGVYRVRPSGTYTDGSPLISLSFPFSHFYFVDLSDTCVGLLDDRIQQTGKRESTTLYTEDANVAAARVASAVKSLGSGTLVFAFIDPYGLEFKWESMKTLAPVVNDFLINVPRGMNLNRQRWHQSQKPMDENTVFDEYFGCREWRGKNGIEMLNLYTERLRTLGFRAVGNTQSIRLPLRNVLLYDLVFASKNPKGAEFWDKICSIDSQGQRALF